MIKRENRFKILIGFIGVICLFYIYILNGTKFVKVILSLLVVGIVFGLGFQFKEKESCDFKKNCKKKLNLGCGRDIKQGYINLDILPLKGVDVVHDLEKTPFPFKKDYFDEAYASHILEHEANFIKIMEELHRICKKDAIIKIKVPYFASASAFQDPQHIRFFTLKSFNYFLPENYNNYITKARFRIIKKKLKITRKNWIINLPIEFIINLFKGIYERFFVFLIPFPEVYFELKVLK